MSDTKIWISGKYTTGYNQRMFANKSVEFHWFISEYTLSIISGILIIDNQRDVADSDLKIKYWLIDF